MVRPPHTCQIHQHSLEHDEHVLLVGCTCHLHHTSGDSPGDHPERNQVHPVSLPKSTNFFGFSIQPKTIQQNYKTQRPAGASTSGLQSTAAASSQCSAAKIPCSRRHCCLRKNVSSQVMCSSSASTLAWRSARPRSCASTPSKSRFDTAGGTPPTPCPGVTAGRHSGHGDGGCRGLCRE